MLMLTFCCDKVDVVRGEIMEIYGIQLDQAGRCRHYHSEADVVALRCRQCHITPATNVMTNRKITISSRQMQVTLCRFFAETA